MRSERLREFVTSEVLNAAYYGSFDMVKSTIDSRISKICNVPSIQGTGFALIWGSFKNGDFW
jgi:hypothetical protein